MNQANTSATEGVLLPADDCRNQLDRILKSADFEATARERRFLAYVAEETLAERAGRIKAYSIAVEVFGRDASFDPQRDPIVRIEAGHLRRSLERYYLTAGQGDPIVITIPKGAYVPTFTPRTPPASEPPATPAVARLEGRPASSSWRKASLLTVVVSALVGALAVLAFRFADAARPTRPEIPRVLVERFDDLSKTGNSAAIANGLSQEVVGQLAKFKDIVVVESTDTAPGKETTPPRFVLAGSVSLSPGAFRLRVRFLNRSDRSILWANDYDGDLKVADLIAAQTDIARNVATSLAQTYGVIFQVDAALKVENPPEDWQAYACTLSYYAYRIALDPKLLPDVRSCLEQAVDRFPTYATAWGLLSQVYIDQIRFSYPFDPAASTSAIERSLDAARRAVELDPLNIRGLQGEMFALYFSEDVDGALAVGKRAMEINPNDTELMGEYGYRLALSGDWAAGCPLVEDARDRNPGPFAYYESALALCAYFAGDYQEAAKWIKRTVNPTNVNYHAIAAAIFGEGGFTEDAKREKIWMEENGQEMLKNMRHELALRLGSQEDIDALIASLAKAGLRTGQ